MSLIQYVLISTVCLSLLYLAYKLIYKNETHFRHLRVYLMGSVVLSLLVPFNRYTIDILQSDQPVVMPDLNVPVAGNGSIAVEQAVRTLDWTALALKIYFVVAFILLFRIILQFIVLAVQYLKSDKLYRKDCILLINHRFKNTFSFFGWIFIAPNGSSDEEMEQIITHERIHAAQYHSFDLIILELLTAVMWFNPLIWKMKHTVQLVHEYLADEGALNTGIDRLRYQALLINQVTEERLICLSSGFNPVFKPGRYSLIKNRMKMIANRNSNRCSRLKILTLLPLAATLFILMALMNGIFPERLHAGTSKKSTEPALLTSPDPLLQGNTDSPGDTIKKKTIVKVIKKENPGDTVITETVEVIIEGDTNKTVKVIGHDGVKKIIEDDDLIWISEDEDIEHVKGIKHDSVKYVKVIRHGDAFDVKHDEKYDVKHDEKYDVMHDEKKDVIIIREREGKRNTGDATLSNTLVIIDGEKHTEKDAMAGLDPDEISEMMVLKDKDKIKKYTDKDYDAVIVITTRNGKK